VWPLPPSKDRRGWFIIAKLKQLQQNISGHGDVAQRHDKEEPYYFCPQGALPETHPYKKGDKAEVRVEKGSARPGARVPAEFSWGKQQGLVGLDMNRHGQHPKKNAAKEDFQEYFHNELSMDSVLGDSVTFSFREMGLV
jgi:hypothetical protein